MWSYLDKVEVLGDDLVAVIHDEDAADVEFDGVFLFFVFEQVEGGPLGNEEERSEFELTLHREVFHRQVVLPVVRQRFVELGVLFIRNVVWVTGPDRFRLNKYSVIYGYKWSFIVIDGHL